MVTGRPIDEVSEVRSERHAQSEPTAREAVEAYNDAVRRVLERGALDDHVARAVAMENIKRVGRRGFLTGAGKAAFVAAATLAAGDVLFSPQPAAASGGQKARIAIIGGGLAGLRCAHQLWTKYGWTSTVYEANQSVGGRCETLRNFFLNGDIAEMHGEFISSEHTSMLNLAKSFNLTLEDYNAYPAGTVNTYWLNGTRYTQAALNADWQASGWKVFNDAVKAAPWPQFYNTFNAQGQAWDKLNVPQWINQYLPGGTSGNLGGLCLQNVIDEYGGDPADQSALNLSMILGYYDSSGGRGYQPTGSPVLAGTDERWHIVGGNDQIVSNMVSQLPAGTVRTGQALLALKSNADGTFTLTFSDGTKTTQVTADSVVLTPSFKVLRTVDLTAAGLSALKMRAINELGMGSNGKIIMQFNGHPWQADGYNGTTYQDNGFIASGWEMLNREFTGPTGVWTAYPGGSYTQQVLTSYGLTQHEAVAPTRLVNDTLKLLEPVLPGVTKAYNGKAWYHFGTNDPYVQGGYPYWRVGQCTSFSGYEDVKEGRIHFAGDFNPNVQGYMEGAVTGGERAAMEIHQAGA
jgi:monoamine oxidase